MSRPSTDPIVAAQAMNLGDAGYSGAAIANMLDISDRTARHLIRKHGRWAEVAERPVFAELRRQQKIHLESASRAIAAKCLIQVEEKLDKASAYQAAGIYGLLRTHERLDAGEPTEIIGHVTDRRSVESVEALAAALSQVLITRQTNAVADNQTIEEAKVIK